MNYKTATGFIFFISLLLWASVDLFAQTCTFTVSSSSPYIDAQNTTQFPNLKAGDTVCLKAGTWDFLYLRNFHGTAGKPITFVNQGGTVVVSAITKPNNYFGIKIGNCSYVIFRGNGVQGVPYGFQVDTVAAGAGMSIDDLSTHVEVSQVEIAHTAIGGVYAKTDPTCGNYSATRDKFTMYDFSFHDNYVHDVPNEGLYIGNSHFSGMYLSGCDTTVYPHVLKGVKIYNNIIEHSGYDGIQVSSADSGCVIHDNTIRYDSYQKTNFQMSGILIGGGSQCNTYNNKILNGNGDGIDVFGLGNYKIFNNLIVNAGMTYYPDSANAQKHGVYVGTDSTYANASLGIYNNTIVSPKSFGIDLNNSKLTQINVTNNLIVEPGKYATDGTGAFINIANGYTNNIEEKTNFTTDTLATAGFVRPDSMNFDLRASSAAVGYGTNLTAEDITFDILNRSRPATGPFDAGAYEHDTSTGVLNLHPSDVKTIKIYPNPVSRNFQVELVTKTTQTVKASFSDALGRTIFTRKFRCEAARTCHQTFSMIPLKNGWYFINIFTKSGRISLPVIVEHNLMQ